MRDRTNFFLQKQSLPTAAVATFLNLCVFALWFTAALTSHEQLLHLGMLAYFLGLRHGFDADHIAAIDSIVRKLRYENRPASATGLWFALGHSTIVTAIALMVTMGARGRPAQMLHLEGFGRVAEVAVAAFLSLIAAINFAVFKQLYAEARRRRLSGSNKDTLFQGGLVARMLRRFTNRIDSQWKTYPVGLLFGLGFDTASEIAMLVLSATVAAKTNAPVWSVMVLPAMFTAGMTLVDTADGLLMTSMYDWAAGDDNRRIGFNLGVTAATATFALLVAGVKWLEVSGVARKSWLNPSEIDFGTLGMTLVAAMLCGWLVAWWLFRRTPVFSREGDG